MKIIATYLIILFSLSLPAQSSRFTPKMAPIYAKGYYVNIKGDTVVGEVQVNPQKQTDIYHQFSFKSPGKSKPRVFAPPRIKAYGFSDRNFVLADIDGEKIYLERLADGRLRFYEYKYEGKVDGNSGITADYFIKDTRAEGQEKNLTELRKLPKKFYKKALKPYMQDQPMIWSDLDKYVFDEKTVLKSINEFNEFYEPVAN